MSEAVILSASGQPTPFQFQKQNGALFKLFLKTLLLSVVTFGIYFFWGRVAITKFIYNKLAFGKRSFDYHATGKEQFIGFLKGIGILAVVGIIVAITFKVMPLLSSILLILIYIGAIFFLTPFVIMGKWKFMMSRSSYCNVRFKFIGKLGEITKIWIKGVLLTIVTLGFYGPVLQNKLQRYLIDNSRFGSLEFGYTGQNSEYFWIWLKGILLSIITIGIYSFWFMAKMTRFIMSNTTINGKSFNSTITGWGLFKTAIINMLTVIFTLGFGFPIAVNRMYGYFFSNLTLDASPEELETVAASFDTSASAFASGIEDAANVVDAISGII